MRETEMDRWPFVVLMCVCLGGLFLKAYPFGQHTSPFDDALAGTGSDLLIFLGGVGGAGLLCMRLFGPARVESRIFWVFLAGIVAAAILFCRGT